MSANRNDSSLAGQLPYWEFFSAPFGHIILNDGSLVAGLNLGLKDIECLDDAEINQFTFQLRSVLNSISEETSVQFHFKVDSDFTETITNHINRKKPEAHQLILDIAANRESRLLEDLKSGALYKPKLTVFLRTKLIQAKKAAFFSKPELFSKNAVDSYGETLEVLNQNIESFRSFFESSGLKADQLSRDEIVQHIYSFLNPKRSELEPSPKVIQSQDGDLPEEVLSDSPWLATQSPREQLVFGDLLLNYEQFSLDGHYHRIISLKTLPEVTFAGQLSSFLRMPFHYDLFLSFEVPSQADEKAKLKQRRNMAHSMASTQSGKASDLESESKLSSTEELIRELLNSGQRIYAAQMTLVLKAPADTEGAKELNRQCREVLGRFRSLNGAEGLEESVGAWKIVRGNLPAAPMNLERARKMKTNNLADFLPVYGSREGDRDPVVILRNRMNGIVSFDSFDSGLPNYNSLVTGSSGAGKSFLNNCILMQEMARNLRVFIIDIGGSYKKLTESLGGQYLDVNLSPEYQMNPFHIPDANLEPSNQKLKSLIAVVESMVTEDSNTRLPKLERVLLEKTIIELYEEKRRSSLIPKLSDLADRLNKSAEDKMRNLGKMLYMWTGDRPFGRLLDGLGSLRTDAPICTFDLKGLSSHPDLQSVMILILTDFILNQVESDKSNRKRIILDEAWELLKSPAAASFMEYCARTLRKTGSGITFITQGVEEIVASPIGAAILNNTATKFIMLQRGDTEILAQTLKLNQQEISLIQSLEQRKGVFSEGFLIEGDHRQVIRVYPSATEYWLSTSDAQDNAFIESLRAKGSSLPEAIKTAALQFPNGIAEAKRNSA